MGSASPERTVELFFERSGAGDAVGFTSPCSEDAVLTCNGQDVAVGPGQFERAVAFHDR